MAKAKEKSSLADRLHLCAVPVLLLIGTSPHRAMVSPEERDLLQQRVRRLKIRDVPGAGRYIQEERPEWYLRPWADWIDCRRSGGAGRDAVKSRDGAPCPHDGSS